MPRRRTCSSTLIWVCIFPLFPHFESKAMKPSSEITMAIIRNIIPSAVLPKVVLNILQCATFGAPLSLQISFNWVHVQTYAAKSR
ncbi:hypothetical protein AX774_g7421 [Zancudomyces culisetae]|uniref:Secreted protein n=1 Tax=Zancudomyces culisetae TaxID=1213189 RepID=A0A1R1PE36_ZANCU|nr:hypothetical protein AX774_g7421 [Zancudomyces culisetae]|eukprot:OMH79178.1 hypothetical protein AX774_g7421 [Zancudomyces culisetae]